MIVIGAGGHARVVAGVLRSTGISETIFWVDKPEDHQDGRLQIVRREKTTDQPVIIGIGDNRTRKRISAEIGCSYGTAIHKFAILADQVRINPGTVCMAGSIINENVTIGAHTIINTAAVVDHDCIIGDFVHISPNATLAGNVQVEEGAWVGAGSTIIQGVRVGKWSIVAAGAVVLMDVPDFAVVAGVPAKVKKYNKIDD